MIEPGFPTLLAHPALSFALAALALALAAIVLVREGRKLPAGTRSSVYWQRLRLLAEVLLALGLIGLALFAGRITVAADQQVLAQQVAHASGVVQARLHEVVTAECNVAASAPAANSVRPRGRGANAQAQTPANLTPFNPGVAANDLCAIARAHAGASASAGEWLAIEGELRAFGARYPGCVSNVFSRNNDCETTIALAASLQAEVATLAAALQAQERHGARLLAVHGNGDWGFALLSAFLAAAGLAIRIARAAAALPRWGGRQILD